jgi:thiosulfate/3-mercaptopyruvate sulfurtransferase
MEPLISTAELGERLGAPDLVVFDCSVVIAPGADGTPAPRANREAYEAGHIPHSGFLDLVEELSDPAADLMFTALPPDRLAAAFAARGVGPGVDVVLYDRMFNMWATRAWWLLRSIGFDRAAVLDGGWQAWTTEDRPTSTDPAPTPEPGALQANPRPGVIVGRAEVEAATTDGSVCLVNALSSAVHDGTDTSYGRPGHIPSSKHVFAADLGDRETHCYRPLEELRTLFADAEVAGERIITWCGGGIAATSDAFILTLLGHDDVAIYDGSLSEWQATGGPLET